MFARYQPNDICFITWNESRSTVSIQLKQSEVSLIVCFRHRYSRRILVGLIFCCFGDAFLVYPDYFEIGMICFGIGHINYIRAFGFKPLNLPLGVFLYALNATGKYIFLCTVLRGFLCLFPGMLNLLRGLQGVLAVAVPLYSLLICTMVWRAIARAQVFEVGTKIT